MPDIVVTITTLRGQASESRATTCTCVEEEIPKIALGVYTVAVRVVCLKRQAPTHPFLNGRLKRMIRAVCPCMKREDLTETRVRCVSKRKRREAARAGNLIGIRVIGIETPHRVCAHILDRQPEVISKLPLNAPTPLAGVGVE